MTNTIFNSKVKEPFFKIPVNIKKLTDTAKLPTQGSEYAAGWDLYADIKERILINPHETKKIGTGIATELPNCVFGTIVPRSGVATKRGLRMANPIPIVDSDYRGEWIIALHNDTDFVQWVDPQERIAQMVILPCITPNFKVVDELNKTERNDSGFGDSGKF